MKAVSRSKKSVARSNVKVEFYSGELYEVEIFVAKKCINLSELYEKIFALINDPQSLINGYSIYEVEGDWRSHIEVFEHDKKDLEKLKSLMEKHGKGAFKDLIRPIISKGSEQFAVFDETSIVLKIMIQSNNPIEWDDPENHFIAEIKEIFNEITKIEKNIFFTVKELKKVGSIKRYVKS